MGAGSWTIAAAPYASDNLYVYYTNSSNVSYWGYVESAPTALDLAEVYPVVDQYLDSNKNPTIEKGAIVCRSDDDDSKVTKCTKSNSKKIVGAITTKPSTVMGLDHLMQGSKDHEKAQVALTGKVPVIVTSINGHLNTGDPVTSSSITGFGQKSISAGMVVGTALENSDWNDQRCPAITSINNIPWPQYPNFDEQHRAALNTDKPCFKLPNGMYVGKIMVFTNTSYYDPNIELTSTGQINVNYNISDSVLSSLGYHGTKNEIESAQYNLTDNLGNTVNHIAQFSEIASAKIKTGFLSVKSIIADNLAVKNLVSQNSKTENLKTNIISPLSDNKVIIDGDLEVNETLTAQNIQTSDVTTDNLESQNATISGTLYADNIISSQITSLRDELKKFLTESKQATSSALLAEAETWTVDLGATSTTLDGDLSLTNNLILGAKLTVKGDTQLANAFVTGTFSAGEIAIQSNFIETTNTALYIQPSNTGSVHLMGDTLVIAENGEVTVNGNLAVNGKIQSASLFANLIEASDASISGTLTANKVDTTEIKIATDSASTIIAESGFASLATTSAQLNSNATAGTATLPIGKTELVINNNKLTDSSMVYLTPVGSTNNQVLYVKDKTNTSFTIALDQALDHDITINWWIIN